MAVKKQFLKTKPICKVTFSIAAPEANSVVVAGDFNNWNESEFKLKKLKNGTFKGTENLETEKTYEFKYIIDGAWVNDPEADGIVQNEHGTENSVVKL